jgi:hypothetical protein
MLRIIRKKQSALPLRGSGHIVSIELRRLPESYRIDGLDI